MRKYLLLLVTIISTMLILTFSISGCRRETIPEEEMPQLEEVAEDVEEQTVESEEVKEESLEPEEEIETEEEPEKEFSPSIIGNIHLSMFDANVYVAENYAYIAGGIIDVSNKENPMIAGSFGIASINWWRSGFYVEENFAYFADENCDERWFFLEGDLQIIDISNKDIPTVIGTAESMGRIKDVWVTENYAYATYEIFKTKESGIQIIDISNKKKPLTVGVYEANDFPISSIRIEGEYLYVLIGDSLNIIDITDRENLVYRNSYPIFCKDISMSRTLDFYIEGDYLYLPFENFLKIIDVSDRENLVMVTEIAAAGEVTDVFVNGFYAYITYIVRGDESENGQVKESGMQIIDIEDKNSPFIVAELDIPGSAMGIFVEGDYAYVGAMEGGLNIIKLFN